MDDGGEKRKKKKFTPSQRRLDKLGVGDDIIKDDIAYLKRKVKRLLKENISLAVEVSNAKNDKKELKDMCETLNSRVVMLERKLNNFVDRVKPDVLIDSTSLVGSNSHVVDDDDLPF